MWETASCPLLIREWSCEYRLAFVEARQQLEKRMAIGRLAIETITASMF